MNKGDVSAKNPDKSLAMGHGHNLPGQAVIVELLRAQELVKPRSILGRVFGWSPLSPATRVLYDCALGEIEVGDALHYLSGDWVVLHALPVGSGATDIDHIVIGPSGVYVIDTSNQSGQEVWASQRTFMVGGVRQPHIRDMEYEMGRVERLLSVAVGRPVEVSGILAVVAPRSLAVADRHRDVAVLNSTGLVPWLVKRRAVLSPNEVREIATAASKGETWHRGDLSVGDRAMLRARFDALRSQVVRAWRVQVGWVTACTVLGAGAFIYITYAILLGALHQR